MRTCKNKGNRICPLYCGVNEVCDCTDGYRRNDCGKCVKEKKCDTPCTNSTLLYCFGPNETADGCFYRHREQNCGNYDKKPKPISSNDLCVLGECHCIDGYVRNECGICVHPKHCRYKCKKPNPRLCSDPNEEPIKCYKKSTAKRCYGRKYTKKEKKREKCRKHKCDCRDGFFRNKCGKCVRWDECKLKTPCKCTNPCTKKHEISRCINACTKRSCATKNIKFKCKNECIQQCDCIPGYLRNNDFVCVPENQCPKTSTTTDPK